MKFLLATRNKGKIGEMRQLLADANIEPVGLDEANIDFEVEETGNTFAENAYLKASEYARLAGMHAIADDSGLEVSVLDGRPGVLSARYAGENTEYNVKIPALLKEINESGLTDRSARFVSRIAVSDADGNLIHEAEGICSGRIAEEARGTNGFGYDPVFIPDGYDKTFGELGDEVKQTISHRSIAIMKIIRFLRDFA